MNRLTQHIEDWYERAIEVACRRFDVNFCEFIEVVHESFPSEDEHLPTMNDTKSSSEDVPALDRLSLTNGGNSLFCEETLSTSSSSEDFKHVLTKNPSKKPSTNLPTTKKLPAKVATKSSSPPAKSPAKSPAKVAVKSPAKVAAKSSSAKSPMKKSSQTKSSPAKSPGKSSAKVAAKSLPTKTTLPPQTTTFHPDGLLLSMDELPAADPAFRKTVEKFLQRKAKRFDKNNVFMKMFGEYRVCQHMIVTFLHDDDKHIQGSIYDMARFFGPDICRTRYFRNHHGEAVRMPRFMEQMQEFLQQRVKRKRSAPKKKSQQKNENQPRKSAKRVRTNDDTPTNSLAAEPPILTNEQTKPTKSPIAAWPKETNPAYVYRYEHGVRYVWGRLVPTADGGAVVEEIRRDNCDPETRMAVRGNNDLFAWEVLPATNAVMREQLDSLMEGIRTSYPTLPGSVGAEEPMHFDQEAIDSDAAESEVSDSDAANGDHSDADFAADDDCFLSSDAN